jgi:hypothetical protein
MASEVGSPTEETRRATMSHISKPLREYDRVGGGRVIAACPGFFVIAILRFDDGEPELTIRLPVVCWQLINDDDAPGRPLAAVPIAPFSIYGVGEMFLELPDHGDYLEIGEGVHATLDDAKAAMAAKRGFGQ